MQCTWQCSLYNFSTGDLGIHISMTTWATDFKFAGAIVQRLYLVTVVLTQTLFISASMRGFLMDGPNFR